ncbi:hypothetical protein B0H14DRAFT_2666984 [Mycena olivaceomarginata]|nr:hypothetical protein B0H14DRAFT_2666984 [Mycena olivaceomarginata]
MFTLTRLYAHESLLTAIHGLWNQLAPRRVTRNEDRYIVQKWALRNGDWTFAGWCVPLASSPSSDGYDIPRAGYGGSATVDFVLDALPRAIVEALRERLSSRSSMDDVAVGRVLVDSIVAIDISRCFSRVAPFEERLAQLTAKKSMSLSKKDRCFDLKSSVQQVDARF